MTVLYKFYKNDCVPCRNLDKLIEKIILPPGIDLIEVDVTKTENNDLVKKYDIKGVPVLAFESGSSLVGMCSETMLAGFLKKGIV